VTILSAQSIRARRVVAYLNDTFCTSGTLRHIIEPFREQSVKQGLTGGLGPCGYDVHLAQTIWLWPFWGRIASTIEHFHIPHDLRPEVCNKSSLARRFIWQPNTTAEPGWRGHLTLELMRLLPWPVRLKKGTPIVQVIFHQLDKPTDRPYVGKYQDQGTEPERARYER
jgi:dCTP deaminase